VAISAAKLRNPFGIQDARVKAVVESDNMIRKARETILESRELIAQADELLAKMYQPLVRLARGPGSKKRPARTCRAGAPNILGWGDAGIPALKH
jgi:hypothetical protein